MGKKHWKEQLEEIKKSLQEGKSPVAEKIKDSNTEIVKK